LSLKDSREKVSAGEEKERGIREQVTNISHDLRTPLSAIKGYFELMEGATEEERLEYLDLKGGASSGVFELSQQRVAAWDGLL